MFSRLTRLPLRRCIHTASTTSRQWSRTAKVVFGASVATATYMTWHLTNERNRLALDSINPTKISQGSEKPSLPPESSSNFSTSEAKSSNRTHVEDDADQSYTKENAEETSDESAESTGGSSGAFNPQTGEINWDCPCLGGMAHGPCGPEFREAFSCFVFSEVEPKGMDCVEKFKAMQTCFRAHPDVYADEIMDDDEDDEPVTSEHPEGVPPALDSSETIVDPPTPQPTSEKKPQLQKAGIMDR